MEQQPDPSPLWYRKETSLKTLTPGFPNIILEVKVDRIITTYVERTCTKDGRPCLELQLVDFIIYGTSKDMRMMVKILSTELMEKHCWKILEGSCYQINNFFVREGGERVHDSVHLEINDHSTITPSVNSQIPDRFFIFKLVDEINWWGYPSNSALIDVCGVLRSFYRSSKYKFRGIFSQSLILELEDKRKKFLIRCILMGDALEMAFHLLSNVYHSSPVFIVIKYAMITQKIERGVELSSVSGTTRVYVNPEFPEIAEMMIKVMPN